MTAPNRILAALFFAASLSLFPATAAEAHDTNALSNIHQHCLAHARGDGWEFLKCLRASLSAEICAHPSRNDAFRTHNAKHAITGDNLCRRAAKHFCGDAGLYTGCGSLITHECFAAENLCVKRAYAKR